MKTFICITVRIALILLVLATIAHAFYQSSLPPEKSTQQSDKVGEIIEEIVPPETKPGEYIQQNIRKLAHFTEFFFLGLWAALYAVFFARKAVSFVNLCFFGMAIALLDETVQIFSQRGPSVKDVWIDLFGYAAALLLVLFVLLIVYVIRQINRVRCGRISI